MKKILIILLLLFLFAGCTDSGETGVSGASGSLKGVDNGITSAAPSEYNGRSSPSPYTDPNTGETYGDITKHPEYSNYLDETHGGYDEENDLYYEPHPPVFETEGGMAEYIRMISANPAEPRVLKGEDEKYYYMPPEIFSKYALSFSSEFSSITRYRDDEPMVCFGYVCPDRYNLDDPELIPILGEETIKALRKLPSMDVEPATGENIRNYSFEFTWEIVKDIATDDYMKQCKKFNWIDGGYKFQESIMSYYIYWRQDGYLFFATIPEQYIEEIDDLKEYTKAVKVQFKD